MIPALLALACLLSGAAVLVALQTLRAARRPPEPPAVHPEVFGRLAAMEARLEAAPRDMRTDLGERMNELRQLLAIQFTQSEERFGRFAQEQGGHLNGLRTEASTGRKDAEEALGRHVTGFSDVQTTRLGETNAQMKALQERTEAALKAMDERLSLLTKDQGERADALKIAVQGHLDVLREGNEKKLDEMRGVVDEKLSATLEQRLGEKFKTVSDHLESVHKAVGEMQSLATGVGDLKRVLTNVKTRGAWGEIRLGQLLEDILPGQYESQVAVRAGAGERVDFAIRLPGKDEGGAPLWLPVDCKFPQEDYERLQQAHERGEAAEVEACALALERAVRVQAKSIAAKYVHPPQTTAFAFLYLPTEGLYAEVIRRPGLVSDLLSKHAVMVAGPSTLTANLMSLQVGFKSLAVEKRASEVWNVLGDAKAEFAKFGVAWDKLGQRLDQAKGAHEEVARRTKAINRKLLAVDALEVVAADPGTGAGAPPLLALAGAGAEEEDEAA